MPLRFKGVLGVVSYEETSPGVVSEVIKEIPCQGHVTYGARRLEGGDEVHKELNVNNSVAVLVNNHIDIFGIRYLTWRGSKWLVSNVELKSPRLILTLRGLYVP